MNRTYGAKWLSIVALAVIAMLMLRPPAASAHIVYAGNAFADIGLSEYREEIVYASRLGLIASEEGGDVFRPADPLLRADLAQWAAAFYGLAAADDPEGAGKAALDAGLVASLEGQATYGDIDRAVFRGGLTLEDGAYPADRAVTREQYAAFVVKFAATQVEGKRLEEHAGLAAGPAGVVQVRTNADAAYGYEFLIDGKVWTLGGHPRIVHAPGDPALWDGRELAASWIAAGAADAALELLDFKDTVTSAADDALASAAASTSASAHVHVHPSASEQTGTGGASWHWWLYVLAAAVLAAIIAATVRGGRRRKGE